MIIQVKVLDIERENKDELSDKMILINTDMIVYVENDDRKEYKQYLRVSMSDYSVFYVKDKMKHFLEKCKEPTVVTYGLR